MKNKENQKLKNKKFKEVGKITTTKVQKEKEVEVKVQKEKVAEVEEGKKYIHPGKVAEIAVQKGKSEHEILVPRTVIINQSRVKPVFISSKGRSLFDIFPVRYLEWQNI